MLDYRIKTFLTLYDEMNYRKTAVRLNMTQPGVTQHIHFIENHYGVKLFSYNGKTLEKTKNADILKRYVESVMAEEQDAINEFYKKEKRHKQGFSCLCLNFNIMRLYLQLF